MIKESLVCVLLSSGVCFAQTTSPVTESFINNFSVNETFTLVKYDESALPNGDTTLVQFLQGVDYKICDNLTASLNIPVYFADSTNLGAINLVLLWDAVKSESLSLSLGVGVYTPMETEFGASSVDPSLSGVFTYNLPWGGASFVQTAEYEFVTGDAYSLAFGSKVSDDILTANSSILCPLGDHLDIGVTAWQTYTVVTDGQQNVQMGPNASWHVTSNVDINGSFAVPVYQNVNASADQDYVVSAALSIKF